MNKKVKIIIGVVVALIVIFLLVPFLYFKSQFISKEQVKSIVLNDIKGNDKDVYFEEIDLEFDKKYYKVEIYYNNNDYEYKIEAKTGRIIYTDYNYNQNNGNNNQNGNNNGNGNGNTNKNKITLDEATNIALKHANLTLDQVRIIKKQEDYDDNIHVYEIEFYHNTTKYDYKIKVNGGEIISFDKDYN